MHNNNVMMRCRVCGLLQADPPWGMDGKCPTYDFCACCGVEFGYGDASPAAILNWRNQWLAQGARWDEPEKKPADWDLQEQLSHLVDLQPSEL
jgi:hypothetical protein